MQLFSLQAFTGFTALRPCALLRLQVTRTNLYVRVSVMCINTKTKCKEKVRKIKVGKCELQTPEKVNTVLLKWYIVGIIQSKKYNHLVII